MAAPLLLRSLIRSGRSFAAAPPLRDLLAGGIVRETSRSRQMATMQRRLQDAIDAEGTLRRTVAAAVRGRANADSDADVALDEGFGWLRRFNEAVAALRDLRDTGALEPRRARPDVVRFGVGMVLYHRVHGRCCVYGWEADSRRLREATRADLEERDIVDNRAVFSGLDPGVSGSSAAHYRCLFADGTARVCSEEFLEDPGLRPADAPSGTIKGSSVFFVDTTDDRLVPNAALARFYPDDGDREASDIETSAAYSVQWMRSWRALGRRGTEGPPPRRDPGDVS